MNEQDRRAVMITGGASGIGLASAEALAADGWQVVLADRDEAVFEAAERLGGLGTQLDVRDAEAVDAWMNSRPDATGLVTSAGICTGSPLVHSTDEEWTAVMDINFMGTVRPLRAFARNRIAAGGGGAAVLISSGNSFWPAADMGQYCASKAAVGMLSKVTAAELGRYGIRVNELAPGQTVTPMTEQVLKDHPQTRADIEARTPLGRLGRPEDIAGGVRWLLSPDAGWVTGQLIPVDGGISLLGEPAGEAAHQELG